MHTPLCAPCRHCPCPWLWRNYRFGKLLCGAVYSPMRLRLRWMLWLRQSQSGKWLCGAKTSLTQLLHGATWLGSIAPSKPDAGRGHAAAFRSSFIFGGDDGQVASLPPRPVPTAFAPLAPLKSTTVPWRCIAAALALETGMELAQSVLVHSVACCFCRTSVLQTLE